MHHRTRYIIIAGFAGMAGCSTPQPESRSPPNIRPISSTPDSVGPASRPTLAVPPIGIRPMYREILAIDLPAVMRVAAAQNIDVRQARERVEASRGRLESTQGAIFPVLSPTATFEHVDGTVRASQGNLIGVGFDTFQLYAALQMVLNPGRVAYEIVAARKRLAASEQEEAAVVLETLRTAAVQFYELLLARARVAAARQAVTEADELLRIVRLRLRTGTGVRADELRAEAELATREQDLALSLNGFYNASIALAVTLHLDAAVTLAPPDEPVPTATLVREDIALDELLGLSVQYRPDLASVRQLAEAAIADRKAAWWTALGAQFQVGYQYGGITGHADNVVPGYSTPNNLILNPFNSTGAFSTNPFVNGFIKQRLLESSQRRAGTFDRTYVFSDQDRWNAAAAWRLSISAIGDLKTAGAAERSAAFDAERRLDQVRAQVVREYQASETHAGLIPQAARQIAAAEEALRLTQANLKAGTMTTLDVLQADDALARAQVRYAEAILRYNQSQVNLAAAVGLLQ